MYFGESAIKYNNSFDIFYENTFERIYNFNLNSIMNDLSLLEHLSLVKEDSAAIALPGPVQKTSFKEKIMNMIKALINWIKNAFKAFIDAIVKLFEKIKYSTFQDKVLQKIFGDLKYQDLLSANEKGWKGISRKKYWFINPNINHEMVLKSVTEILEEDNINLAEELESMKLDYRVDKLKEQEEKISKIIYKLNEEIKSMNTSDELLRQSLNNDLASIDLAFSKSFYDWNAKHNFFNSEESYQKAKQDLENVYKKFVIPFIFKLPEQNKKSEYVIPDENNYNTLKNFVLNYKEYLNKLNQKQKPIISDIDKSISSNLNKIKELSKQEDTSNNNFKECEIIILRTTIKISDAELRVYKTVIKNFLDVCKYMFIEGFKTYSKIVIDVKKYIKSK